MPWSAPFSKHLQGCGPPLVSPLSRVIRIKAQRQRPFWALLEAARVLKKKANTSTTPAGFSVSSFPRTRLLLLMANLTGCKHTGAASLQELSEVKWIRHSALNQIACEASSPQGRKGRRREKRGANKNKFVLYFFNDSSQWSLITHWQCSCFFLKKLQKAWKKH